MMDSLGIDVLDETVMTPVIKSLPSEVHGEGDEAAGDDDFED
jgi:hypothetical protein